jgi:hypothetical protein
MGSDRSRKRVFDFTGTSSRKTPGFANFSDHADTFSELWNALMVENRTSLSGGDRRRLRRRQMASSLMRMGARRPVGFVGARYQVKVWNKRPTGKSRPRAVGHDHRTSCHGRSERRRAIRSTTLVGCLAALTVCEKPESTYPNGCFRHWLRPKLAFILHSSFARSPPALRTASGPAPSRREQDLLTRVPERRAR